MAAYMDIIVRCTATVAMQSIDEMRSVTEDGVVSKTRMGEVK